MNRHTHKIMTDILCITQDNGTTGIQPTKLLTKAKLPHKRFNKFMNNLLSARLINKITYDGKYTFAITEKGIKYLREYKKFESLTESFGLYL